VRRCLARSRTSQASKEQVMFTANLGLTRFRERNVAGLLADALEEFGVAPHQLLVEFSERDMLDSADTQTAVHALRELGVGIAIDDFGVGWSNLSRLDVLTPDIVKIDRSLITPLGERPGARRMLSRIIELAHDLGAVVVGEGVETLAQLDVLRELGCDAAQGFLIGRPAPWPDDTALGPRPLPGWQRSPTGQKVPVDAA
jgi:diguanylate cyclase